jgi:hypothetical protein
MTYAHPSGKQGAQADRRKGGLQGEAAQPTKSEAGDIMLSLRGGIDRPDLSTVAEWVDLIKLYQDQTIILHNHIISDHRREIDTVNEQRPPKIFAPGALVWLQSEQQSKKTLGVPKRTGPYTVISSFGHNVTISDLVASGVTRNVHVSRLMDYTPSSTTSAVELRLKDQRDVFVVESIVSHSFSTSTRNKPDGLHNLTVEVKWLGYAETSLEPLKKNPSLLRTAALLRYFRATPTLAHLCAELPITAS